VNNSRSASMRIDAIDTFRGLTIFLMVFVIQVAGYRNLPQQMSWFGSLPVSTWHHSEAAWEQIVEEKKAEGLTDKQIASLPEANLRNIGLTLTDLVAPFFVFIVGLCIPLSRLTRGKEWRRRVFTRTFKLYFAGVLYISLIFGISWWWGILQAIALSYLIASFSMQLSRRGRWGLIFSLLAFHIVMSQFVGWWLNFGDTSQPFFKIGQLDGSLTRPLRVHCLPWVSISYACITMVGVLLGEAVAIKESRKIVRQGLTLAGVFMFGGYAIHWIGYSTETWKLCFNKADVSASYAMFTAGLASLVFVGIYYLVDLKGYKKWTTPFCVLGVNALLAYFMQIVMRLTFRALGVEAFFSGYPNQTLTQWSGIFNCPVWQHFLLDKTGYNGLLWGLIWTMCLWAIIRFCNRHNIYWKL